MNWARTGNWKRDDVLSCGASQEAQNPGNPRWTSEICGLQSRQDPLCHPHWTGNLDLVQSSKFSFLLSLGASFRLFSRSVFPFPSRFPFYLIFIALLSLYFFPLSTLYSPSVPVELLLFFKIICWLIFTYWVIFLEEYNLYLDVSC